MAKSSVGEDPETASRTDRTLQNEAAMATKNRTRHNKIDSRGRNANSQSRFARLDHSLLHSAAYRSLNPAARSLLIEIISMYNGGNNGALWLSVRDAAVRMGVVDTKTAARALDDLQRVGFIDMTKDAFFSVKAAETSRARCWRVNWEFDHTNKKSASFRWKDWQPAPKTPEAMRADRGLRVIKAYKKTMQANRTPVVDSPTIAVKPLKIEPAPVVDSAIVNPSIDAKQPIINVVESTTHLATAIGIRSDVFQIGWWRHSHMDVVLSRLLLCLIIAGSNLAQFRRAA
jgi:hypothetical protein